MPKPPDLAVIRGILADYHASQQGCVATAFTTMNAVALADWVPALVAEVERLRAGIKKLADEADADAGRRYEHDEADIGEMYDDIAIQLRALLTPGGGA